MRIDPGRLLRAFAQLTETGDDRRTDVIDDPTLITPIRYVASSLFANQDVGAWSINPAGIVTSTSPDDERLLSAAALHKDENRLRVGWLWFAGTVDQNGERVRYCFPALSVPVEPRSQTAWRDLGDIRLTPVGDVSASNLITDVAHREELYLRRQFGGGALTDSYGVDEALNPVYKPVDPRILPRLERLIKWAQEFAETIGIEILGLAPVHAAKPTDLRDREGVSLLVGNYLYLDRPNQYRTTSEILLHMSKLPSLGSTSFAKVYSGDDVAEPATRLMHELRPLSARQRQIGGQLLGQDVSVLSGPPGTGKSHIAAVAALDAVSRGKSVLVAASSHHAVDVLVEHFAATPGPTPVVFGGSPRSKALADRLSTHAAAVDLSTREVSRSAIAESERLLNDALSVLAAQDIATSMMLNPEEMLDVTDQLTAVGDLDELAGMVAASEAGGVGGWRAGRKHRKQLDARLGAGKHRDRLDELNILRAAKAVSVDGASLDETLNALAESGRTRSDQQGGLITLAWLKSLEPPDKKALREIAAAMSADRAERRASLRGLPPKRLVKAAPLWVGSVEDIDEVLPAVASMFDLVILDEASQIDQVNAAGALIRARSAIVCGDPEQLGHHSFLSNVQIKAAGESNHIDLEQVRPGSRSVLDAVAAIAPVQVLDEHFRSVPHLIEFSARRIYGGALNVVTRHPSNERADHIDIRVVAGSRGEDRINRVEVEECLRVAEELIGKGWVGIGFMSPFRAQADALEEAVLARFSLEEIDGFGLRVGTAHSYQGDETRVIIASWAVGEDELDKAWQFVNQRNLFNVMVTRAREKMVVVTSRAEPPGLAGEYVQWAEPLIDLVTDIDLDDPWVKRVAEALGDVGVPVRVGYRVGRHVVDLVAGEGEQAIAIDCVPHVDGPLAHIDRAMMLRRAGWRTSDAYESKWQGALPEFAFGMGERLT